MSSGAEIEVLFGSSGRGDADDMSDRDVLIVDDDPSILHRRQRILAQHNASVAAYSWGKFASLIGKGALFIQHLKLEARILRDKNGRFKRALDAFAPKASYAPELKANMSLFDVARIYPDTKRGALWAADVLFVALRNYGVLRLAEEGHYFFSFQSILREMSGHGIIGSDSMGALGKLRSLKHAYRSDRPIRTALTELKWDIQRAAEALPFPFACGAAPVDHLIRGMNVLPDEAAAYHRLRNLEKMWIALQRAAPDVSMRKEYRELKKWVQDPRMYCGLAARGEREMVARSVQFLRKRQAHSAEAGRHAVWVPPLDKLPPTSGRDPAGGAIRRDGRADLGTQSRP